MHPEKTVRPITAYTYTGMANKQFGLNTADIGNGQVQSGALPTESDTTKLDMKQNTTEEVLAYVYRLFENNMIVDDQEEGQLDLPIDEAMSILGQAIAAWVRHYGNEPQDYNCCLALYHILCLVPSTS